MGKGYGSKQDLLRKNKHTCAICGKIIKSTNDLSPDHVVPLAVFRWTGDGSVSVADKSVNIMPTHKSCNYSKGCTLVDFRDLYLGEGNYRSLKSWLNQKEIKKRVNSYKSLLYSTLRRQGYKCAGCGKKITINNCSIRRKDSDLKRCHKNCVLICRCCNRTWYSDRKKLYKKAG